ncbi:carbohydrate kinase family protein [Candidatus Micrarchaeota archaeon]|nr:carbohydrate kinase family protein [Candidatus Micrarchaeota archaeon]
MERKTALYIGSCTVDVNATSCFIQPRMRTHHRHTEKFVELSFASKTSLDDVSVTTGGSAANSAYTTKVLGSNVDLVCAVGDDLFGDLVLDDFKKSYIPTRHIQRFKGKKTAVGINLLCESGEKTNLVFKGATDALEATALPESSVKAADIVVCTSLSSPANFRLFEKALHFARWHQKPFVFAPSITMLRARKTDLDSMHGHFDVVVMNHEEAGYYTGSKKPLEALHELPGKLNVMTWDANGTFVEYGGLRLHVPTLKVGVKDTTGAGDSFTGALVHGLLSHGNIVKAVQLATAVACLNITQVGAKVQGSKADIHAFFGKSLSKLKPKKVR